jgi:ribosome recycling factor
MQKTIDSLENQLVGIRLGTITPSVIDTVKVIYEGQPTPIVHVAYAERKGNGISVTPYEPQLVNAINKALQGSGFNSYVFSKTSVMVSCPPPSGEEKLKIIAYVAKLGEESKIAVRNIRKKHRQTLTKDEIKEQDKSLQKTTDEMISKIDSLVAQVEARL